MDKKTNKEKSSDIFIIEFEGMGRIEIKLKTNLDIKLFTYQKDAVVKLNGNKLWIKNNNYAISGEKPRED